MGSVIRLASVDAVASARGSLLLYRLVLAAAPDASPIRALGPLATLPDPLLISKYRTLVILLSSSSLVPPLVRGLHSRVPPRPLGQVPIVAVRTHLRLVTLSPHEVFAQHRTSRIPASALRISLASFSLTSSIHARAAAPSSFMAPGPRRESPSGTPR